MNTQGFPRAIVLVQSAPIFGAWVNERYRTLTRRVRKELEILTGMHDPFRYAQVFSETTTEVANEDGIAGAVAGIVQGKKDFDFDRRLDTPETPLEHILRFSNKDEEETLILISRHASRLAANIFAATWDELPHYEKNEPPELVTMAQALIIVPAMKVCVHVKHAN